MVLHSELELLDVCRYRGQLWSDAGRVIIEHPSLNNRESGRFMRDGELLNPFNEDVVRKSTISMRGVACLLPDTITYNKENSSISNEVDWGCTLNGRAGAHRSIVR